MNDIGGMMGAIDKDRHRPWLAYALEEALEQSLLTPKNVIDHANPEVLVNQLPPPVISLLLSRALTIGTFSAAQVLESVPPAVLAEHLDPEVMWRCLKEAAERGGISTKDGARGNPARRWFASVLARALESELILPTDVLRFLPPTEFVAATPKPVLAELLQDALVQSKFDAELVLQHLTPTVIAENLETALAWDCIVEATGHHFGLVAAAAGKTNGPPAKPATATAPPTPPPPPAVVVVKSAAAVKPPEKEKSVAERRAPNPTDNDRTPMPIQLGSAIAPVKSTNGGSTPARADAPPPRPPVTAAATADQRADAGEWTTVDEDRRRSPFSPVR